MDLITSSTTPLAGNLPGSQPRCSVILGAPEGVREGALGSWEEAEDGEAAATVLHALLPLKVREGVLAGSFLKMPYVP